MIIIKKKMNKSFQVLLVAVLFCSTYALSNTFTQRGTCLLNQADTKLSAKGRARVYELLVGNEEVASELALLE